VARASRRPCDQAGATAMKVKHYRDIEPLPVEGIEEAAVCLLRTG
jgi:hypothetical protein